MERLITAYQEDLLSLDELRHRMPELRAREQSVRGNGRRSSIRPPTKYRSSDWPKP